MWRITPTIVLLAAVLTGCASEATRLMAPESPDELVRIAPSSFAFARASEEEEVIHVGRDSWTIQRVVDGYPRPLHSSTVVRGTGLMLTILQGATIEHGDRLNVRVTVLSPETPATRLWIWVDSFFRASVPAPTIRAGRGSATYVLDLPMGSYQELLYSDPEWRYLVVYALSEASGGPFMDGQAAYFHVSGLADWFNGTSP